MGRKFGVLRHPFGDGGRGAPPPFWGGRAGSPSNTMSPGPRPSSIPSDILIHAAIWPQQIWIENWEAVPLWGRGAGSPSDTVWPGPRPTCTPRFILIRPTVWPQCTNVTYRTDRTERSDSIWRTVLQTVAQKQNLCYTGALESILRPRTKTFCNQKPYCYKLLTVYLSLVINCQTTLQL